MGRLILRWILLAFSFVIVSYITNAVGLKFTVHTSTSSDFISLLIGVAILSLLNATLGRIIKFLTLPLNCLTLGIFSLVINALMLMLVASLKLGFTINDSSAFGRFLTAFVASILISFVGGVLGTFIPDRDEDE